MRPNAVGKKILMSGPAPTVSTPCLKMRARGGHPRDDGNDETRGEYFDPESVSRMCAALDAAWRTLSPTQQTPETRNALAKAIVHLSAEGEFDPVRLSHRAFRIVFGPLMQPYVFEVLNDENDAIAMIRSFIQGSKALWPRIVELAKGYAPGNRIRVTDQSGEMVMLVGVTTARRAILMR